MKTDYYPLVTVVMPCHNGEQTIGESIESVINQTYHNWELLIIDDASTDKSRIVIEEYINRDNRIHAFHTDVASGSPAKPRNIGIENAQGDYIAFLDCDDIWFKDKLELQMEYILGRSCDICYSYYEKMSYDGERNNRIVRTRTFSTYRNMLNSNSIPCLTSIIKKSIIEEIRFKNIPQEDYCFWLDILKKGYIAENTKQCVALYRESINSRSSNKIDMFKGYWNVIKNHQGIGFVPCVYHMLLYTIYGTLKYLK